VAIILQRHATDKAPEHYRLLLTVVHADLDKEAPALVGAVIEVDALIVSFPVLGQEGAMLEHPSSAV